MSVAVQHRVQALLQLPHVPGQPREQGVGNQIRGVVVRARTHRRITDATIGADRVAVVDGERAVALGGLTIDASRCRRGTVHSAGGHLTERGPHRRARVRQPEVDFAVSGESGDDGQLVGGQPGEPEHR